MSFSISQMIVDGQEKVIAMDWVYSNADGQLSNQHRLLAPYGDTPLGQVTAEIAVGWLEEQLQNTSEEFDAAISKRKAEVAYAETLVPYQANPSAAPTKIEVPEPEVEAEPEASTMPAKRSRKKAG